MDKTLFDIIKKENPKVIDESYDGGVEGCPQFYKILDQYNYRLCHEFESCSDCWNQKVIKKKIQENKSKKKRCDNYKGNRRKKWL